MFWLSASMLSEMGRLQYHTVHMYNSRCGIDVADAADACCLACRREQYIGNVKEQLTLAFRPFFQVCTGSLFLVVTGVVVGLLQPARSDGAKPRRATLRKKGGTQQVRAVQAYTYPST